jgi:hypothetical protein
VKRIAYCRRQYLAVLSPDTCPDAEVRSGRKGAERLFTKDEATDVAVSKHLHFKTILDFPNGKARFNVGAVESTFLMSATEWYKLHRFLEPIGSAANGRASSCRVVLNALCAPVNSCTCLTVGLDVRRYSFVDGA